MYPNLYYLVKDLTGIELNFLQAVQSFGFFVALAFMSAFYVISIELKRKTTEGLMQPLLKQVKRGAKASTKELALSGLTGFVVFYKAGFILLNFDLFLQNSQEALLSAQGNIVAGLIGIAAGIYLKIDEKNKERKKYNLTEEKIITEELMPSDFAGNFLLIAAVSGIAGAKLFDILENLDSFYSDPLGTVFSFSGLTMYGGLIVGSISVVWYAHKNKINIKHLIDAGGPAVMLAYGVGRIGCHMAGDGDWGIENEWPKPGFIPQWLWSYNYPNNVINAGIPIEGCEGRYCSVLPVNVFPTPLYEAITCILLFFVLWMMRKKINIPGALFCVYLIFNGVERFLVEKIRVNNTYSILNAKITQAEIIAVMLIIIGIAGYFYFRKKHRQSHAN